MTDTRPILIVGAGPTGLTAAMELSRFGLPVRLIDKLPQAATTSKALAIQARTLELFDQRGLAHEMLALGQRVEAATLYGDGQRLGQLRLTEIESRYRHILMLSQEHTERILAAQVERQGVHIERQVELIAFSQRGAADRPSEKDGVTAVLRHPEGRLEAIEASHLVCAEGAHSLVRSSLQLPFDGHPLPQRYLLGDLHLDGPLPEDEAAIFVAREGFVALFPMGQRRFRLMATELQPASEAAEGAGGPSLATLQAVFDAHAHLPARLHGLIWSSHFRIQSRMLQQLRERRIFFGGDAAHIHSPAGGQGMNTGIQDMVNLGWKLAQVWHGADPALLDTFEAERLPVIRRVVQRTDLSTRVLNSTQPLVHALVTRMAPLLLGSNGLQHLAAQALGETDIAYRNSALSETRGVDGQLRAGDRLPDLPVCALERGATPRPPLPLHSLLHPSRFTLLRTGGAAPPGLALPEGVQAVAIGAADEPAARDAFQRDFGAAACAYLVRPDGHLALATDAASLPSALRAHAQRWRWRQLSS